ncbi:hypothetical protein LguiB_018652 [Lonicera macranthoides]
MQLTKPAPEEKKKGDGRKQMVEMNSNKPPCEEERTNQQEEQLCAGEGMSLDSTNINDKDDVSVVAAPSHKG